jgi:hypothetical protein
MPYEEQLGLGRGETRRRNERLNAIAGGFIRAMGIVNLFMLMPA